MFPANPQLDVTSRRALVVLLLVNPADVPQAATERATVQNAARALRAAREVIQ